MIGDGKYYVLVGPKTIGNVFGLYGYKLPPEKAAIVVDADYLRGGRGPCLYDGCLFDSLDTAQKELWGGK